MQNTEVGTVKISEPTNQLILKSQFVSDVFKFEERGEVEAYDKVYQTYTIENVEVSGQSSGSGTGTA